MSAAAAVQRCPRCGARCVVASRETVECLACGHEIKAPVNPLSDLIWRTPSSSWGAPVAPTADAAADRGRHFMDDDEERLAR